MDGPLERDERLASAMRVLTDLHDAAAMLRRTADLAEGTFSDALRIGDQVRRAVRQGRTDRPDEGDCAAMEGLAARLRAAYEDALAAGEVAELEEALAGSDPGRIARLACSVFAGIEQAPASLRHAWRPVRIRQRSRGAEELLRPADIARRIAAPPPAPAGEPSAANRLVEPVVYSSSAAACDAAVALRWELRQLGAVPLLHSFTGDIWLFRPDASVRPTVVLADQQDDEWWAAGGVRWSDYAAELGGELASLGIATERRALP